MSQCLVTSPIHISVIGSNLVNAFEACMMLAKIFLICVVGQFLDWRSFTAKHDRVLVALVLPILDRIAGEKILVLFCTVLGCVAVDSGLSKLFCRLVCHGQLATHDRVRVRI